MANPTTTADAVNNDPFAWFAMIISYLEVKSLAMWMEIHPNHNDLDWKSAWPSLLDSSLRVSTALCIADLNERKLVNPN